ncbi:hypothetical protein OE88DRAFT_198199 [Heliocybe sulcata]|uniref:F-box domain-containing protein n=1 Tax=Heliocybe sulcata TaxID=5364 RepID=A0A5C3N1M7_9AGAM|nr:hypothetical protein OE88DRAFT_198199 [Heliocybe sulcata]
MADATNGVLRPSIMLDLPEQIVALNTSHGHAHNRDELDIVKFLVTKNELEYVPRVAQFLQAVASIQTLYMWFSFPKRAVLVPGKSKECVLYHISELLRVIHHTSCKTLMFVERRPAHLLRCPGATNFQAPPDLQPVTTLDGLYISTQMLLLPPFRDWTIASMNMSPLRELNICARDLGRGEWRKLLEPLTLPHLTLLVLGAKALNFTALHRFLRRHLSIRSLTLLEDPKGMKKQFIGRRLQSQLHTLKCTPTTLCHFLGNPRVFRWLDKIVLQPPPWSVESTVEQWNDAIRVISKRAINRPLHLELVLGLPGRPLPEYVDTEALGVMAYHVDELTLDLRHSPNLINEVPEYLRLWLTAMRNARYVRLLGHQQEWTPLSTYIDNIFPLLIELTVVP